MVIGKKLLIFDLDGTLVNTVKDLNAAINYSFEKNNFPLKSVEHTSRVIGNGIAITLKRSVPESVDEEVLKKVLKDFRFYYKDHYLDESYAYKGMKETLIELKQRGYLLAVATNKLDEIAKKMINTLYPNIFDIVQGNALDKPVKPDPFTINHIIDVLSIDRSGVTYIGDSEVDIESASNADVNLLLVDYGFHRNNEFVNLYPNKHIKSPEELLELFK